MGIKLGFFKKKWYPKNSAFFCPFQKSYFTIFFVQLHLFLFIIYLNSPVVKAKAAI